MTQTLIDATIPELPNHYKGKVRDCYVLDNRRIMITTDRLSAFDRVIGAVPEKGRILTELAEFWFKNTIDLCPNYMISKPEPNVIVGKQLRMLPVEIVVRDYLAGTTATSLLTMYKNGQRQMYGITLPDGLHDNEILPATIITPTTKSDEHDEPISPEQIIERGLMTEDQWLDVEGRAFALFTRGVKLAHRGGLILVDTKYEFGLDEDDRIVLADEIHTPDSSRYWFSDSYTLSLRAGVTPRGLDKDIIRQWISDNCNPYTDPIPEMPSYLINDTTKAYANAYRLITGKQLVPNDSDEPILERIRRNLSSDILLRYQEEPER